MQQGLKFTKAVNAKTVLPLVAFWERNEIKQCCKTDLLQPAPEVTKGRRVVGSFLLLSRITPWSCRACHGFFFCMMLRGRWVMTLFHSPPSKNIYPYLFSRETLAM